MIAIAIEHGQPTRSHGCTRYTLTDRRLRRTAHAAQADRLRGLEAVVSADNALVTVKWNRRAAKPGLLRKQRLRGAASARRRRIDRTEADR